jgi:hypothetical protein
MLLLAFAGSTPSQSVRSLKFAKLFASRPVYIALHQSRQVDVAVQRYAAIQLRARDDVQINQAVTAIN